MRFTVITSDKFDTTKKEGYKKILSNYNLKLETVICNWNEEETTELWHIDINSLDQLIELHKILNKKLIILNYFVDEVGEEHEELTLEIYDGYRNKSVIS